MLSNSFAQPPLRKTNAPLIADQKSASNELRPRLATQGEQKEFAPIGNEVVNGAAKDVDLTRDRSTTVKDSPGSGGGKSADKSQRVPTTRDEFGVSYELPNQLEFCFVSE